MWIAAGLSYSSASISVKGSSAEERTGTKDASARSASALRAAGIRTEVAPPEPQSRPLPRADGRFVGAKRLFATEPLFLN